MDLSLQVSSGGPTSRGAILRSNQSYLELLGSKTTLDWGIAFTCDALPALADGHQFREVWIDSADDAETALATAEAFFADIGVRCDRWALAESQDASAVDTTLTRAGFHREDRLAATLTAWPEPAPDETVRILPARPMRSAYLDVWRAAADALPADQRGVYVDAADERLGDHRVDAFVAMVEGRPAGVTTLFQVGDVARIIDTFVYPELRRRKIGAALFHHVILIARRLTMRIVCAEVRAENRDGRAFLTANGFVEDGTMIAYRRNPQGGNHPATAP